MLSPARRRARAGAPALGRARLSGVTPGTGGTTARQRVRAAALRRRPAHARRASVGPAARTCPPMPASAHVTDLARALAAAFLAGTWHADALARRGRDAIAPRPAWRPRVARAVVGAYHHPPHDRPRELATFVALQLHGLPEPRRGELAAGRDPRPSGGPRVRARPLGARARRRARRRGGDPALRRGGLLRVAGGRPRLRGPAHGGLPGGRGPRPDRLDDQRGAGLGMGGDPGAGRPGAAARPPPAGPAPGGAAHAAGRADLADA